MLYAENIPLGYIISENQNSYKFDDGSEMIEVAIFNHFDIKASAVSKLILEGADPKMPPYSQMLDDIMGNPGDLFAITRSCTICGHDAYIH